MSTLSVKRNDSLRAVLSFTEDGAAANLSGCTARLQIRVKKVGTLLLVCSTADYLTIDGLAGTVTVEVPASEMDIPTGKHEADLELTYADGTVRSSSTFIVIVLQDITRDDPTP